MRKTSHNNLKMQIIGYPKNIISQILEIDLLKNPDAIDFPVSTDVSDRIEEIVSDPRYFTQDCIYTPKDNLEWAYKKAKSFNDIAEHFKISAALISTKNKKMLEILKNPEVFNYIKTGTEIENLADVNDSICISTRLSNALKRNGVETWSQLSRFRKPEVLHFRGIHEPNIEFFEKELSKRGLSFDKGKDGFDDLPYMIFMTLLHLGIREFSDLEKFTMREIANEFDSEPRCLASSGYLYKLSKVMHEKGYYFKEDQYHGKTNDKS